MSKPQRLKSELPEVFKKQDGVDAELPRWLIPDTELDTPRAVANHFREISDDDIDFMLKVAAYIPARLDALRNIGYPHPIETADDILKNSFADCGMKEFLYQHIMNAGGLQTRRVGFENVPIQLGHSCTEVEIDGRYHFVDASFGVHFTEPDGETPLSIAKARRLFPEVETKVGVDSLFTGQPAGGYTLGWKIAESDIVIDPTDRNDVAYIDQTYFLSRLLCADEIKKETVTVPVDLRRDTEVFLGQTIDGGGTNLADVQSLSTGQFLPGLLFRLGSFDAGNVQHSFIVLTNEPCRAVVEMQLFESGSTFGAIFVTAEPIISPEYTPEYNPDGNGWRKRMVMQSGSAQERKIRAEMDILPPFTTVSFSTPWGHTHAPRCYHFQRLDV